MKDNETSTTDFVIENEKDAVKIQKIFEVNNIPVKVSLLPTFAGISKLSDKIKILIQVPKRYGEKAKELYYEVTGTNPLIEWPKDEQDRDLETLEFKKKTRFNFMNLIVGIVLIFFGLWQFNATSPKVTDKSAVCVLGVLSILGGIGILYTYRYNNKEIQKRKKQKI